MTDEPAPSVAGKVRVEVVASDLRGDVLTTTVRITDRRLPGEPITPAALYEETPWREVLRLDRVVRVGPTEATFATFDTAQACPAGCYLFQSWWTRDAHALVTNTALVWRAARYNDEGADFCPLTWQSLNPGDEAFTNGLGSWISPEAYRRFIERDELRLRRAPPPGDIPGR